MRKSLVRVGLVAALCALSLSGASIASADEDASDDTLAGVAVSEATLLGTPQVIEESSDGTEVVLERYAVTPGQGDVGAVYPTDVPPGTMVPYTSWGASYATSTETLQLVYTAKAKAAANIYDGKRIIKVCVWYSWGNYNASGTKCSSATGKSSAWVAGPEAKLTFWDNLSVNWPQTIFNIQTTRVSPNLTP